jgi:sugar phosphate isomerase/epimerase
MAIQSEVSRKDIRGPGLFLAQFLGDHPPFDTLEGLGAWAAGLGFVAVQLPTSSPAIFDLARAAESQTYADEVTGQLAALGLSVSELSTHLQGQLVAVHPAYDALFAGFAPAKLRANKRARTEWAVEQLLLAAKASARMGLSAHATFSGALAWPYMYPWPQRPEGLVDEAFGELARLWRPILDAFDEAGVDLCFELHPGEDLHDGATFEHFLGLVGGHARAHILYDPSHMLLQQMDYLGFLDLFHDRVKAFHVKDAEFRPDARSGVYGGYQGWLQRPGRFRSTGDGQIDFRGIFSKLAQYGYAGWAVLEWEDCLRGGEDGARRGAAFIREHMLRPPQHAFDDFAGSGVDRTGIRSLLGLPGADA